MSGRTEGGWSLGEEESFQRRDVCHLREEEGRGPEEHSFRASQESRLVGDMLDAEGEAAVRGKSRRGSEGQIESFPLANTFPPRHPPAGMKQHSQQPKSGNGSNVHQQMKGYIKRGPSMQQNMTRP